MAAMGNDADSPVARPAAPPGRLPARAVCWQLRRKRLELGPLPRLMGIINVTPDSFSDGGRFLETSAAIEQALRLAEEGADLLDIGGESTRPYSSPVDAAEQRRRVMPVIEAVCQATDLPVSIDTSNADVAQAALEAGTEVVNDVTALTGDPRMLEVVLQFQPGVCVMHMQGTPQTMQDNPQYEHPVREILRYLAERRDALLRAGLSADRICLDPGIGFGKTHEHNLTLLRHCHEFHSLGAPILIGHSRKGFVGKLIGNRDADRTAGTLGVSLALARQRIQVLRVHDVRATREALVLFEACGGLDEPEGKSPRR
jgi:dihydropteroate synthase